MRDRIFATISMLGLIVFVGIVMVKVREPDLLIVCTLVLVIGIIFFRREFKGDGDG